MKTKQQDWKAVRHGRIYCAPACGGGCTWAQYQNAVQRAAAMVKRLGKGWKIRVHENLGWHYSAELITESSNGNATMMVLKVYEHIERGPFPSARNITYTTLFGTSGGEYQWHVEEHSSTPEEAVRKQQLAVERYVRERVHQLQALQEALGQ